MLSFAAVASLVVLTAMWGGLTNETAPTPYDSTDVGEPSDDTLGPCGCTDYHTSDCPIRTSAYVPEEMEWYDSPFYGPDDSPEATE